MSSGNISSLPSHPYFTRSKTSNVGINYKDDSDVSDNECVLNIIEDGADSKLDMYNYRKFLSSLYPSKHMTDKITAMDLLNIKSKLPSTNIIICNQLKRKHYGDKKKNYYDRQNDSDEMESEGEGEEIDSSGTDDEESNEESDEESDEEGDEGSDEDEDEGFESLRKRKGAKLQDLELLDKLTGFANDLLKKNGKNPLLKNIVQISKKKRRKTMYQHKLMNVQRFKKLLTQKDNSNDIKFFKNSLDFPQQNKILEELSTLNQSMIVEKPYRILLLEQDIPAIFKIVALKKIGMLENMDSSVGEFFKIKNWVDNFMQLPFNKFQTLPVSFNDGLEKCNEYMERSIRILDDSVYGLNDAKIQIMQLIGQWISNPNSVGTAIAIKGPMGTGKTTLVKEGISKILNRPFALITLGGATDSSFLEGHSYTYEGSTWGKIVDILIQTKCSNPIIYFDELDKVSDTPRGEEIIGILTHLIDTSQNKNFHDKYFSEIDFDMSKALFIFSYNDESKINPILRDRMYRISTKGYDVKEKLVIANEFLIPTIYEQVNFKKEDVVISDDVITHVINNYTEKEDGVRNLKRCLEIIYTKLNLFRLMKSDSKLFRGEKSLKVEFPYTLTTDIVEKLIKIEDGNKNWMNMYM